MKKIILLLTLVIVAGCAQTSDYPGDSVFEMKRYGAFSPQDWTIDVVIVKPGQVNHVTYGFEGDVTRNTTKTITQEQYEHLLSEFKNANFLERGDVRPDALVTDVGMANLTLKTSNISKTVHIDPLYYEELPSEILKIVEKFDNFRLQALEMSSEEAEEMARDWIKESPTYAYDGYGLGLQDHAVLESYPSQHVMTFTFESRHAGYGNRSGQMLAQVITPHKITVKVVNRRVVSAVIDEKWNVLEQEYGQKEAVRVKFQPMQCENTPWQSWYEEGNVNYVREPTQEQLIIDYYSSSEIEIQDVLQIESDMIVCQACGVCPSAVYYTAQVKSEQLNILLEEGWKEMDADDY